MPPPQQNYADAVAFALAAVQTQSPEQLEWLGARREGTKWALPVLSDILTLDLPAGALVTSAGRSVGLPWRILTLHYLAVRVRPEAMPPAITFADLPGAKAYAPVYQGRVIERLCHTAGRTRDGLLAAGRSQGGREIQGGDLSLDFVVYPRMTMCLIWHAGDEEFPPSATLLLPRNVEALFRIEDITVLSERLVSRLSGGNF